MSEIVVVFETLFEKHLNGTHIQEMASPKRKRFEWAHKECTFKPNANNK